MMRASGTTEIFNPRNNEKSANLTEIRGFFIICV